MSASNTVVGLDIVQVREDFEEIWLKNTVEVTLSRDTNKVGGDYFQNDIKTEPTERKILLNIQGVSSDSYSRERQGIETSGSTFHVFSKYDEDIENTDVIYFNGVKFIIKNLNKGLYEGQTVFKEFDIISVGVDDRNFN